MGSQKSPYFEVHSVLYTWLLLICIHETLSAVSFWSASQTPSNSLFSWNHRPSFNQRYQHTQNPWRYQGYPSSSYKRPTTPPTAFYRNAPTYPHYRSSSLNRFPQQQQLRQWPQQFFPSFMPSMNAYRQANRLEPFLPRPSGDRNIPLTPGIMRLLGMSPHGHMMNRMGLNQPYGPDRTVGGITVDGSDISYA